MLSALIQQPFGLGDCIFSQGVARHFMRLGYKIYWPVTEKYINGLRRAYPEINWISENFTGLTSEEREEVINARAVPIRWSDTIMNVPYERVMRAKYDMYKLDWSMWRVYAKWNRNAENENFLYDNLVGSDTTQYNIVSEYYTGSFKQGQMPFVGNNGLRTIRISPLGEYSLFDWAKVIENATEIHFVASSNIYLLELLELKADKICIYTRKPDQPHHKFYDYILRNHDYILK